MSSTPAVTRKKSRLKNADAAPVEPASAAAPATPPIVQKVEQIAISAIMPSSLNRKIGADNPRQKSLVDSIALLGLQSPNTGAGCIERQSARDPVEAYQERGAAAPRPARPRG